MSTLLGISDFIARLGLVTCFVLLLALKSADFEYMQNNMLVIHAQPPALLQ